MTPGALSAYKPEIDGLRALAVLGVLFFHVGMKCPGGYCGVDVFFVISGYLITGLILRDLSAGTFSMQDFWERRCRRIVPALAVMVLITLIAGGLLLLADDYRGLGKSVMWQTLFASNVYFWTNADYFSGDAEEKPLMHTWSLAVEEQFYFFIPLVLLVLARWRGAVGGSGGRSAAACGLGLIALASFMLSLLQVSRAPTAAFFLLPSRAWELLSGALLAVGSPNTSRWPAFNREFVSLFGLCSILICYFSYDFNTPFPGLAALPPVLGALAFIAANQRSDKGAPPTLSGRLMACRPLVFVGLISYSLYLWHWPLLAFVRYWSFTPIGKGGKLILVLLSFLLGLLSWRLVETPFRRRSLPFGRQSILALSAVAAALLFICGAGVWWLEGLPARMPVGVPHGSGRVGEDSFMFIQQNSETDIEADRLATLGMPGTPAQAEAVIWGDSHAMAAVPAFDLAMREAGIRGCVISHSATVPLVDFPVQVPNGPTIDTLKFNQKVLEWIKSHQVRHVFLAAYWHVYEAKGKIQGVSSSQYLARYQNAILDTVSALVRAGRQPWILLQVPDHPHSVPKAYAYCRLFGADERSFCARVDHWNGLAGSDLTFLARVKHAGARIIDVRPTFLSPDRSHYVIARNGFALYGDKHHLNKLGSEAMLTPVIRESLKKVMVGHKTL